MTTTARKFSLKKILYDYRHVAIPLLVYSCELTRWAVLNRNGIGEYGWSAWRIALLVCLILLVAISVTYSRNDIGEAYSTLAHNSPGYQRIRLHTDEPGLRDN